MELFKNLFNPPITNRIGPFRVTRYWRDVDEEKLLGVCRTQEEVAKVIREDMEVFGVEYVKEFISYHVDSIFNLNN